MKQSPNYRPKTLYVSIPNSSLTFCPPKFCSTTCFPVDSYLILSPFYRPSGFTAISASRPTQHLIKLISPPLGHVPAAKAPTQATTFKSPPPALSSVQDSGILKRPPSLFYAEILIAIPSGSRAYYGLRVSSKSFLGLEGRG